MTKQRRLAYDAIKVVSQGNRGAVSKLIAVLDVSRQTYYQGLKRQETEWESHDRVLKARTQYCLIFIVVASGPGIY
ncbi:transposase [Lactiplantibacillus plantarum]|uniref:Transposase n=1 Tax=Lactiplantibacillus plantarum (strain ATCC BAA-793 / NCIMB 8826 / WCFS1) TaxID=220668 RepID=F9UMZ1_LACPL|nr:transposase [Lactiplantibacillus plantarum]CCC78580.1 transposase, fragment [Lactiplantibacillus plantarum WCFS1]MDE4416163.1 transposase [Lactiplantibacillus plantarum]MDE4416998.1 transposase [Lactiplantibacillus plantarum]MDE4420194.1 transposase [Lactiplantibacillus plantarum]MDE4424335.1 transposase [Lactiplantibacillus plantarum]